MIDYIYKQGTKALTSLYSQATAPAAAPRKSAHSEAPRPTVDRVTLSHSRAHHVATGRAAAPTAPSGQNWDRVRQKIADHGGDTSNLNHEEMQVYLQRVNAGRDQRARHMQQHRNDGVAANRTVGGEGIKDSVLYGLETSGDAVAQGAGKVIAAPTRAAVGTWRAVTHADVRDAQSAADAEAWRQRVHKSDRKQAEVNPALAAHRQRQRAAAEQNIKADSDPETWRRRDIAASVEADGRNALGKDRRAWEQRYAQTNPSAFRRYQAQQGAAMTSIVDGSGKHGIALADARADQRARERETLAQDPAAWLARQSKQTQARFARADASIEQTALQRAESMSNVEDVLTFNASSAVKEGKHGQAVVDLVSFGGGTAAASTGRESGRASAYYQQADQLDRVGAGQDAQQMRATADAHRDQAGVQATMLALSAVGTRGTVNSLLKPKAVVRTAASGLAERVTGADGGPNVSEILARSRAGQARTIPHGVDEVPVPQYGFLDRLANGKSNLEGMHQAKSVDIYGASDAEADAIVNHLSEMHPHAQDYLPLVHEVHVVSEPVIDGNWGTMGIMRVEGGRTAIILNRSVLNEALHEVPDVIPGNKGGAAASTEYARIQAARDIVEETWRNTTHHEHGHVMDFAKGRGGRFHSESMPEMGRGPWFSQYAERTGKKYEDLAEGYADVADRRWAAIRAGESLEELEEGLRTNQEFGPKYGPVIDEFFGGKL